jgi:hypothetical protein
MRIIENGKPSSTAAGCAWAVLLVPILFFGGGWLLGKITDFLTWLLG